MDKATWIAVDWGTTNIRVWALKNGTQPADVIGYYSGSEGMKNLQPDDYEPLLLSIIDPWLSSDRVTPVIICGMAGARTGWIEAPYASLPYKLDCHFEAIRVPSLCDQRITVHISSGLMQENPKDVMRGEETLIRGLIAQNPNFKGTVLLPGTHSKWVDINQKTVQNFRTYMTGELYEVILNHTILKHCNSAKGNSKEVFIEAFLEYFNHPSNNISSMLFSLRAQELLTNQSSYIPDRVSAFLIAEELKDACQKFNMKDQLAILGSKDLAKSYQSALSEIGIKAELYSAEDYALYGLELYFNNHINR